MATYHCHCGKGADILLLEVRFEDGQRIPGGKAWACCKPHLPQALPEFIGLTVRVHPVSRTWKEHVERRTRENATTTQ